MFAACAALSIAESMPGGFRSQNSTISPAMGLYRTAHLPQTLPGERGEASRLSRQAIQQALAKYRTSYCLCVLRQPMNLLTRFLRADSSVAHDRQPDQCVCCLGTYIQACAALECEHCSSPATGVARTYSSLVRALHGRHVKLHAHACRPLMRAPLSGSMGSGDGTGDGSRDGSTRDGDSDEAPTLSGRVTGLRSARQRPKRVTPDEVSTLRTFNL